MNEHINIREAEEKDTDIILGFIKELAVYEKLLHEVTADETLLKNTLFEKEYAKVLIAEYNGKPAGMALYFHSYSTFLGKPGIYLEDLYVSEKHRGKGIGKKLLKRLAAICNENDFGRLEWSVLDWNKPSIDFYESLGAKSQNEWIKYRVDGETLKKMSE
jgi:GNAT superfamily N-acetyltransferase